ncbi:AraC family transcriptional regulator [Paenibacillus cremeus]|uniref:AraC family transcriptional regulator n=1 Tax=Paenibacillus cremeus TaxID=2163881 RepID=A0A559KDJ9_9BACL|nr:AraC family transcriptional regulator [Paenibacillus cremeus]TVY10212.1 AraC family transcriptional regulator [Paenibacillus cremeus]
MKVFQYHTFMNESFPFKIEVKDHRHLSVTPYHAHEYLQICYVIKGTCIHNVGGRRATLVKGDLFSVPPLYEHCLELIPDKEAEVVHIDFMPFLLDRNLLDLTSLDSFVDFAYIQPFVQFNNTLLPKLNLSYEGQRVTEHLISEMINEFQRQEEGYPFIIKSDLQKLLVIAGREFTKYSQDVKEHQLLRLHRKHFEEALAYIDEQYMNHIKLQDAAAKANMSPTYFSTVFKLVRGMTYIDYVNDIRVVQAMKLLKEEPDWSVERISAFVGFNHLTHFYRMFRKKNGLTPAEFRRKS